MVQDYKEKQALGSMINKKKLQGLSYLVELDSIKIKKKRKSKVPWLERFYWELALSKRKEAFKKITFLSISTVGPCGVCTGGLN